MRRIRGYAGKIVDIKRITKNPNPGFSIFSFFVSGGWWGWGGRVGWLYCCFTSTVNI